MQWGADSPDEIEGILSRLEQENYLNEQRFANAFANDKMRFQGWGRLKIRAALLQKHVSNNHINEALLQIDETTYRKQLTRLANKKAHELRAEKNERTRRQKVLRFLASRGFTMDEICAVLPSFSDV